MNGENNNGSNANYDYNNNYSAYSYEQYPNYYYQQYYSNTQYPQQHIPQGDPSAVLSTITQQYQQQQQQQQQQQYSYNAYQYSADYYNSYYASPDQRSMINYGDLSYDQQAQTNTPAKKQNHPKVKEPELLKPKFCCYKTLKSNIAIAQHEKLHVKCPTCDFWCLPSILQEHEEIFHGKAPKEPKKPSRPDGIVPAYAPRISTPEELEAWIAARKKNWPSKLNVERKEQEIAEKIARGEIVPHQQKRKHNQQQQQQQQAKKQKTAELEEGDSEDDSDDTMDPERDAVTSKDPLAMGKILLPEDRPIRKRVCKYFAMGRCNKGNDCTFLHELPEKQNRPKQPRVIDPIRKRPNLLFKLLEKEILQEKSVILQCLRYIADNILDDAS